ncbi:MAG: DUF5666 domain-containing protein [Gammaproteobacteria bacterium]|nr:DUF5666 domain-containing protein [Gammaproteobacteria bacterium]
MKQQLWKTSSALLLTLSLFACEGGGITGTGFKDQAVGVITGFGSVLVNGIKFETNNTKVTIDDIENALETELKVGMIVNIQGEIDENGLAGFAKSITYSDDVEGTVLANNTSVDNTLNIMGQTIIVSPETVFGSQIDTITRVDEIQTGNIVEVSGFNSGDGFIYATRVEVKKLAHTSGEAIEVSGLIKSLDTQVFLIGDMTVDYRSAELVNIPSNQLLNDMFVEVRSTEGIDTVSNRLIASRIKLEGDGKKKYRLEKGQEIELEGVVADYNATAQTFNLNGQTVVVSSTTEFKPQGAVLRDGAKLSVNGSINAKDELLAEEIEIRAEANLKVQAYVEWVDSTAHSFKLLNRTFLTTNTSVFNDERNDGFEPVRYMNLDHLRENDFVEVSAYYDEAEDILIATHIERDDPEFTLSNASQQWVEINGLVAENHLPDLTSIKISGITIDISQMSAEDQANYIVGKQVEIMGYYDEVTHLVIASPNEP